MSTATGKIIYREGKPATQFHGLSEESQQKAREVLAGMLLAKYQSCFDLPDNTVNYLGHRVREAFAALEEEKPARGSGEEG